VAVAFTDVAGDDPSSPRHRILAAVLRGGPMSRAQLARAISLAPSTVTTLVRTLTDEEILVDLDPLEVGDEQGQRSGPRGTRLSLNPRMVAAVGVDFGFQHVRVLLCDLSTNILAIQTAELPEHYTRDQGISTAARLVEAAVSASGFPRGIIVGAGVALPGPIDTNEQRVVRSGIQPGWGGTRAADFAAAFGFPVLIENDANLAALGEHVWGAGRGERTTITIKFHSGIGAGIIVNDALVSGAHGGAGEIGHIMIDPRGPLCRCGKRGCLDTYAAVPAILEAMMPMHPGIDVTKLLELLDRNDPGAQRIVGDAATLVGQVVGSACLLLAPDSVIVVGAIARAGDVAIGPIRDAVMRYALPGVGKPPTVKRGLLGDRHTAMGGVAIALRHYGWLPPATKNLPRTPAVSAHVAAMPVTT
jgi:predicted NBD/HSP70 family sugar kinase